MCILDIPPDMVALCVEERTEREPSIPTISYPKCSPKLHQNGIMNGTGSFCLRTSHLVLEPKCFGCVGNVDIAGKLHQMIERMVMVVLCVQSESNQKKSIEEAWKATIFSNGARKEKKNAFWRNGIQMPIAVKCPKTSLLEVTNPLDGFAEPADTNGLQQYQIVEGVRVVLIAIIFAAKEKRILNL